MKNCKSRLCTGPFTHTCYYWWKQSFRVFGTGCDRPSASLQTANNVLSYPSRHILSQHPHSHPSEWVVTEVAKTANIAKMAEKCTNCINARPSPPHTNPMESGPGNTFSAQNKKNQRIHDFRPKKKGGVFFFLEPPPPPSPSLKTSKKCFSSEGGPGGSGPKTH